MSDHNPWAEPPEDPGEERAPGDPWLVILAIVIALLLIALLAAFKTP